MRIHNRKAVARTSRLGFTLLEILIVLAIIGVIAAMAVPNLLGNREQALIRTARMEIATIEAAAKMYAVSNNTYPATINDLTVATPPQQPQLEKLPVDPWGQQYIYEYGSGAAKFNIDKPAIWSMGPNMQNENGSGDDINNWADQQ